MKWQGKNKSGMVLTVVKRKIEHHNGPVLLRKKPDAAQICQLVLKHVNDNEPLGVKILSDLGQLMLNGELDKVQLKKEKKKIAS